MLASRLAAAGYDLRVGRRVRIVRSPGATVAVGHTVRIFNDVTFHLDAEDATITIGDRSYINPRTHLYCQSRIVIGSGCAISWDVRIIDSDYHQASDRPRTAAVTIGDRVWIGSGVTVLKGVTVGDGAVIAAGSLVVQDVPAGVLVAGSPARVRHESVDWKP